jgi:hypothetical protein
MKLAPNIKLGQLRRTVAIVSPSEWNSLTRAERGRRKRDHLPHLEASSHETPPGIRRRRDFPHERVRPTIAESR